MHIGLLQTKALVAQGGNEAVNPAGETLTSTTHQSEPSIVITTSPSTSNQRPTRRVRPCSFPLQVPPQQVFLRRPRVAPHELVNGFRSLKISINSHVHEFMGGQHHLPSHNIDQSLIANTRDVVGLHSSLDAQRLIAMLADRKTRCEAMQHLFAWTILDKIRISGPPETTLLPPEISECMSSMSGMKEDTRREIFCTVSPPTPTNDILYTLRRPGNTTMGTFCLYLSFGMRSPCQKKLDATARNAGKSFTLRSVGLFLSRVRHPTHVLKSYASI